MKEKEKNLEKEAKEVEKNKASEKKKEKSMKDKKEELKEKENKEALKEGKEEKTEESKNSEEKDQKKEVKVAPTKVHEVAKAQGRSLPISAKYSKFICRMIKKKTPEEAIKSLREVIEKKRVVKMASLEVPHQRGAGVAGGKYPVNACKAIIPLINQLRANALVVGIEDPVITLAVANRASAPFRRRGTRAKRTHIYLEARSIKKIKKKG